MNKQNQINQTSILNAFDFNSSIKSIQPILSNVCIYCNNESSIALLSDGSFRQCLKCRKNFNSQQQIIKQTNCNNLSQKVSYQTPLFQTIRTNYLPSKK